MRSGSNLLLTMEARRSCLNAGTIKVRNGGVPQRLSFRKAFGMIAIIRLFAWLFMTLFCGLFFFSKNSNTMAKQGSETSGFPGSPLKNLFVCHVHLLYLHHKILWRHSKTKSLYYVIKIKTTSCKSSSIDYFISL